MPILGRLGTGDRWPATGLRGQADSSARTVTAVVTGMAREMNFVEQLSAIVLLVDFLFGVACGVVGGASHGSTHEDRKQTLLGGAPDALSDGARVIYGLYRRDDDGYMESLLRRRGKAARYPRVKDPSGAQAQGMGW